MSVKPKKRRKRKPAYEFHIKDELLWGVSIALLTYIVTNTTSTTPADWADLGKVALALLAGAIRPVAGAMLDVMTRRQPGRRSDD